MKSSEPGDDGPHESAKAVMAADSKPSQPKKESLIG